MAVTHLHLTDLPPRVKRTDHAHSGPDMTIDEARDLVALVRRRPWEGDTTVVHLLGAHQVRDDVWNTLLKVLEEPPPYAEFHLYAPNTDSIPRTIRSRSRVTRESLPSVVPEDASRLIRLIEAGDALAILREGDRHTDLRDTRRVLESLWVYAVDTGRLEVAVVADYYLARLRQGTSPRVLMKAALITIATRYLARAQSQAA